MTARRNEEVRYTPESVIPLRVQPLPRRRRAMARSPLSTPDVTRLSRGLGDVKEILQGLVEKQDLSEAREARTVARVNKLEMASDQQSEDLKKLAQRTDNGMSELLATSQRGNVELRKELDDVKKLMGRLEGFLGDKLDENATKLGEVNPEIVKASAEGGAAGAVKASNASALSTILKSRAAWVVAGSTGFVAICSAFKNIPPLLRVVGHFIASVAAIKTAP